MLLLENRGGIDVNSDSLEFILKHLSKKDVELILVDKETMQDLNKKYRDVDKPTDVLSFPLEQDGDFLPLGSVVICHEVAKEVSDELGHSFDDEVAILFIHGVLHLLGFDHEKDSGQMRAKEEEIAEYFKLPKALIVRIENGN